MAKRQFGNSGENDMQDWLNAGFSENQLAGIACAIEPSDGTMYAGVNMVNHKTGELIKRLEWWPDFTIVMCIPPYTFNTESADFSGKECNGAKFENLLNELETAIAEKDSNRFCHVCRRSAEINQSYLPNPIFQRLAPLTKQLGASGICIGHTGTVVGVLFCGDDSTNRASNAMFELPKILQNNEIVQVSRITNVWPK